MRKLLGLCLLAWIPWQAVSADDGARLYQQHCAACHGSNGRGGVGVPLALPDFLAVADDNYLRTSIRLGRPGRVMPAFPRLTDSEVDAIVHYVRGWAPPASHPYSVTARPGNSAHGEKLFGHYCASCHGGHGEGGQGTGVTFSRPRDYPILAPALNNAGFLSAASDNMIKATLMRGRAGTPMHSFRQQGLRESDIDDLVSYVRSFTQHPLSRKTTGSENESAVIVRESPYDVAQTLEKLKTAIAAANMRLIRIDPFEKGLVPEGQENDKQITVDSCDFAFLNDALKIDPRVGLFLPCRVIIVKSGDKVLVMAMNPKRLSALFNNAELDRMCERMHQVYVDLLEETVL